MELNCVDSLPDNRTRSVNLQLYMYNPKIGQKVMLDETGFLEDALNELCFSFPKKIEF